MEKHLFRELFEQYQLPLYRYLLQMCRNRQVAEELLQETFYRAMISLKVKNMDQAKAWLFKVARNLYIDRTRKSKTEQRMIERMKLERTHTSDMGNPVQYLENASKREHIELIFSYLPERMRTILYLREIQEFSYKEVAATMNFSESQVKTTLHRARKKFRYYDWLLRGGDPGEEGS
ncbi:RNA polymerase sigma-70 factor, ECF subfamily [Lentibacillus halodurans]|uniref:RNA polymerase sigma-70 factor, ECF subfamily n=1 Tax=Lentibacillus halodurans TaxID=237679 RepID=A0A1I0WHE3_9BACI|nr:sigma-70 family RNA polymerase sigma factor [Lentibacillus halodurans]SFA87984.1 RNA polymerase sigma-70 factor, ECF subfamily [Lentibacillus halodurans]